MAAQTVSTYISKSTTYTIKISTANMRLSTIHGDDENTILSDCSNVQNQKRL